MNPVITEATSRKIRMANTSTDLMINLLIGFYLTFQESKVKNNFAKNRTHLVFGHFD